MTFLEPARFLWLLLLPALAAVALFAGLRQRRNLHRFATPERLGPTLPSRSRARGWGRVVLLLGALGLTLVALADPRRGERERDVPPGDGLSVVFALDVSRSMLAQDVSPTRLDRAKQYVRELTRVLAEQEDDASVGLVAFAGAVKRVAPVTRNVGEVELALQATDVTTAGLGGSNLADAVQSAARSFVARRPGHKVVVMLTDGEENQSGEPAAAARSAFDDRGVRFFTLGLGSPDTGATIPLGEGRVMMHNGEPVRTTLDAAALKAIAAGGGGVYLPAETKRVDMDEVYRRVIRPRLRDADPDAATPYSTTVKAMIPRFGWLVWPALGLLLMERLAAGWPAPRRAARRAQGVSAALLMACVLPAMGQTISTDPRSAYNAAVAARDAGDDGAARAGFAEAALRGVGEVEARARYNLGRAAHAMALKALDPAPVEREAADSVSASPPEAAGPPVDPIPLLDEAVREYAAALGADPAFDDARANLEAAARLRAQLQQQRQQQQQEDPQQDQQPLDENPSESDPSEDAESQEQESSEGQEQDSSEGQEPEPQPSESGDPSEGDPESSGTDPNADPESESGTDSETVSESEAEATNGPSDATAGSERPEAAPETDSAPEGEPVGAEDASATPDEAGEQATAGAPGEAGERLLSRDEAMKLLQRIRDQDLQRRIEQYRRDARRQQRVEKDW